MILSRTLPQQGSHGRSITPLDLERQSDQLIFTGWNLIQKKVLKYQCPCLTQDMVHRKIFAVNPVNRGRVDTKKTNPL